MRIHEEAEEKTDRRRKGGQKATAGGVHDHLHRREAKRIKRPPTVDGMDVDEFIRDNADPIWLYQNEIWEVLCERKMAEGIEAPEMSEESKPDDVPF